MGTYKLKGAELVRNAVENALKAGYRSFGFNSLIVILCILDDYCMIIKYLIIGNLINFSFKLK